MGTRIALIGFGEAGSTFALAAGWGARASAFDIAADDTMRRRMRDARVGISGDARAALAVATVVLSLVTADRALAAARDYAALLSPGALWCDMNSVAPETKRAASAAIEAAGGRYADVAVMAPVISGGLGVPLLVSGSAAEDAAARLAELGFANVRVVGRDVGRASAIKMIRSVMVKGIEALCAECFAAAHAAGVADEVFASLDASDKPQPWAERVAYNLERMRTHGLRRADEMEEAARTLLGLGVAPVMTRGTIELQRAWAAPSARVQAA